MIYHRIWLVIVKHLHVKRVTKYFDSREKLREHSINEYEGKKGASTEKEMIFSCETCEETFTSREDLRQHSIKQHEG
jgi:hypothetical protein